MRKERPWKDVTRTRPKPTHEVCILRKNGEEEIGYYYKSRSSGITWIDQNGRRIIGNAVVAWREKQTLKT